MESIREQCYQAGLVRRTNGKVAGGVCSGLAAKFGIDVTALRVITVILVIALPGSPILFYLAAWVLMPDEFYRPGQVTGMPPASPAAGQPSGVQDDIPPHR